MLTLDIYPIITKKKCSQYEIITILKQYNITMVNSIYIYIHIYIYRISKSFCINIFSIVLATFSLIIYTRINVFKLSTTKVIQWLYMIAPSQQGYETMLNIDMFAVITYIIIYIYIYI